MEKRGTKTTKSTTLPSSPFPDVEDKPKASTTTSTAKKRPPPPKEENPFSFFNFTKDGKETLNPPPPVQTSKEKSSTINSKAQVKEGIEKESFVDPSSSFDFEDDYAGKKTSVDNPFSIKNFAKQGSVKVEKKSKEDIFSEDHSGTDFSDEEEVTLPKEPIIGHDDLSFSDDEEMLPRPSSRTQSQSQSQSNRTRESKSSILKTDSDDELEFSEEESPIQHSKKKDKNGSQLDLEIELEKKNREILELKTQLRNLGQSEEVKIKQLKAELEKERKKVAKKEREVEAALGLLSELGMGKKEAEKDATLESIQMINHLHKQVAFSTSEISGALQKAKDSFLQLSYAAIVIEKASTRLSTLEKITQLD